MAISRLELQRLIDDFGEIPGDLKKELPKAVREGSKPMLGQIKANASWSSRIPSTVRVVLSVSGGGAGIRIVAGGARAPHAVLYEGLSGDPFRHPLFGNREKWYPQTARPFFYKAVDQKAAEVVEKVGDAVTDVIHRHGF